MAHLSLRIIHIDIQPLLTRSGIQHAGFYPQPNIVHNVGTQADVPFYGEPFVSKFDPYFFHSITQNIIR